MRFVVIAERKEHERQPGEPRAATVTLSCGTELAEAHQQARSVMVPSAYRHNPAAPLGARIAASALCVKPAALIRAITPEAVAS
jgi:hypothetical protein